MNELIELLQRNINDLESQKAKYENVLHQLDNLIKKLDKEEFLNIPLEDLNYILDNISEFKLVKTEKAFLETFQNNEEIRNIISEFGFDIKQEEVLLSIRRKIQSIRSKYADGRELTGIVDEISQSKKLVLTFRNADTNIITDFEYLKHLFNKYNIPLEKQKEYILNINKSNMVFYNNVITNGSINVDTEIETIDADSLADTNISKDDVILLFNKYGIDFNALPEKYRKRLLKYGNLDKFSELLKLLKSKGLSFIFEKSEILTKVLLYSNAKIINEAVRLCTGMSGLIIKLPSILFPELRERNVREERTGGTGSYSESGGFNKFKANMSFFESVGINPHVVYNKCVTLFAKSPKVVKRAYEGLKLYGISITEDASAISVLSARKPLDELDVAIECNALDYIMDNLSRLADNNRVNLYRIKYNDKLIAEGSSLASKSPYVTPKTNNTKRLRMTEKFYKSTSSVYGDEKEDTFELYEAVQPVIENKSKYDAFIENINAASISQSTIDNPIVKDLDARYMVNNYIYRINGVIISRFKVIRYLEMFMYDFNITLDLLVYIVTKNTMLDANELERVMSALNETKVRGTVI